MVTRIAKNTGITYALSLAGCPEPTEREMAAFPAAAWYNGLELTGRLIDQHWINNFFSRKRIKQINVTDLMPSSITRGIAIQRPGIVADFKHQFSRIMGNFKAVPVDCVAVDFSLDEAGESNDYRQKLELFLRGFGLDLYMLNVRLAMPVRIPEYREGYAQLCLELRDRLMLPSICFTADIYPHELGKDVQPEELLRWLRFDLGTVRFFYEPEIGNHLVPALIEPWLKYLYAIGFAGMITFCPRVRNVDQLLQEADSLRELLGTAIKNLHAVNTV